MRLLVFAIAIAAALSTGDASAQSDDDTARSFYDAGVAAHSSGRFEAALSAFTEGHELSGRPQFLYNIASCHDRLHRSAEAVSFYQRFIEALPEDPNRPIAERRVEFLQRELAAAQPAPVEEPVAEPEPRPVVEPDTTESSSAFFSAPALIGFGVGAAGLVTFAVAGAIHKSRFSDFETTCAPTCTDDEVTSTRRPALIADIGLGVGIAGLAFGLIYALVAGPTEDESGGAQVSVAPIRGGSAVQLEGQF